MVMMTKFIILATMATVLLSVSLSDQMRAAGNIQKIDQTRRVPKVERGIRVKGFNTISYAAYFDNQVCHEKEPVLWNLVRYHFFLNENNTLNKHQIQCLNHGSSLPQEYPHSEIENTHARVIMDHDYYEMYFVHFIYAIYNTFVNNEPNYCDVFYVWPDHVECDVDYIHTSTIPIQHQKILDNESIADDSNFLHANLQNQILNRIKCHSLDNSNLYGTDSVQLNCPLSYKNGGTSIFRAPCEIKMDTCFVAFHAKHVVDTTIKLMIYALLILIVMITLLILFWYFNHKLGGDEQGSSENATNIRHLKRH